MTLTALGWNERRQLEFEPYAARGCLPGRVVGEHRTHYQVATEVSELTAMVTGRLRNAAEQRSDLAGVGDFVALRMPQDGGIASVETVLPRSSALIRKAAGERRPQLLAANVDVVMIVMALDGDFNMPRLERYLALVEASGAAAVVVANKADLSDDLESKSRQIRATAPGVPVHAISARASDAVCQLEPYFEDNRTIALIGSSGVGKSTLTNLLLGEALQATQEVRAHDNRGRHTTTHRQLFVRPRGGSIMDTPGMRGLELWDRAASTPPDFGDIEELSRQCRFRNCQHGSEPSCAVRAAVEAGDLTAERLARYAAAARKSLGRR